jgi:hypothetical protein
LDNRDADHLVWITSSRAPTPSDVIIEKLSKSLVKLAESTSEASGQDMMVINKLEQESMYDWMHLIRMFLKNQAPSGDNAEVEHIARKSKQYHLVDGILF